MTETKKSNTLPSVLSYDDVRAVSPPRPHPDASHHDVHQHPCGNWLPCRGNVQQGRLALHVPMVLLQMVPTNFSHCSRLPCRSSLTCSGL